MKKFLILLAFATVSVASMAQDDAVPTEKYSVSTNSFWSNWFLQTNVTWNSFWVSGEDHLFSTPFKGLILGQSRGASVKAGPHPTSLGASIALGKWFTPGLGLRTKVNGAWIGKAFENKADLYLTGNEQILFNLSNMLCGYNAKRVWNFIPFVGAGAARNFDAEANSLVWSAGLLNTFRLGRVASLNIEAGYISYGKEFIGETPVAGGLNAHKRDGQLAIELGLTWNLGKGTWDKTPDVEAIKALSQGQVDALNAQLSDAQSENARLKDLLAQQQKQAAQNTVAPISTVTKYVAAPVSVFFNLAKAKVASQKDLQNVAALAELAKENGAKLKVTGYADSKTGSAEYNQTLSQKRAETVADILVNEYGVSRDNIEVVAAGGVDTLTPITFNRRATVELVSK